MILYVHVQKAFNGNSTWSKSVFDLVDHSQLGNAAIFVDDETKLYAMPSLQHIWGVSPTASGKALGAPATLS